MQSENGPRRTTSSLRQWIFKSLYPGEQSCDAHKSARLSPRNYHWVNSRVESGDGEESENKSPMLTHSLVASGGLVGVRN